MSPKTNNDYHGFREAGLRLSEAPAKGFVQHSSEKELPVLYAIHAFDKAHVVMLIEENLIPYEDGQRILDSFRRMENDGVEETRLEVGGGFHSGEQYLIKTLGMEVGGRIHLGRSSGDLGVVCRRIYQRDKLLIILQRINELRETLLRSAKDNIATVMPGYTFGQHAQPITLGHTYTAWATMLSRDFERIEQAYQRINTSPAGAGILTGSEFPLNRIRVAELLGFEKVRVNTQDAILPHDDLFETFMVLVLLTDNLARWASDFELWSTSEFDFIEIPDRYCGTSSIMPQKKNPNALQVIRGAAAETLGGLVTAFNGLKGPTGFPILERHYVEAGLRGSIENVTLHLQWLSDMIPALKLNKKRMLEQAGAHWAQATDIAGAIVREKNLPWRQSHQITALLVRLAIERGLQPDQVTTSLLDEAAMEYMNKPIELSEIGLREALDPSLIVARRTLLGGPAQEETERQILDLLEEVIIDKQKLKSKQEKIDHASNNLEDAIDKILTRKVGS